jgi:hypothetical protein
LSAEEETNGSYLFANGLNGLNRLVPLRCQQLPISYE